MGRELGDLVPKTIEWVRVHGESPFFKGDSIPEFGKVLRGATIADRGSFDIFCDRARCSAISACLWPAETLFIIRCGRVTLVHDESCQAETRTSELRSEDDDYNNRDGGPNTHDRI